MTIDLHRLAVTGPLLDGPVLGTLRGCRERVRAMSLGQRWALAAELRINVQLAGFEDRLARRLHEPFRRRTWPLLTRRRAVDRVDLVDTILDTL